ncbi:MAG: YqgE/AlgH family protein [Cytophagaceae bacterium]
MVNKGDILISEPFLGDQNFERTVIVICENNEDGTLGFIFNKPSVLTLDAVMSEVNDFKEILYTGGPVAQDSLHFIYRNSEVVEGSVEIADRLFWGGNYEQLFELINTHQLNAENFRFFLGYSGWAAGQLDEELKNNSWIITSAKADDLFDIPAEDLWRELLKNMGGKYKMISNYPIDPRLN